jgi:small subunit ribosomal protein S2
VLFVGTKRQARKSIQKHAERIGMHYVNDRWLGGSLTNFREIRKRVGRLEELETLEADGKLDAYSKKEGARLRREMRKIRRNLEGIRRMDRFPGVIVVVDSEREIIAVREAHKVDIPVISLLDTDADPDNVDIPIPGNDDAMRAIEVVIRELADSAELGKQTRVEGAEETPEGPQPRRRSRRATTARAEQPEVPSEPSEEVVEAPQPAAPNAQAASPAAPVSKPGNDPDAPITPVEPEAGGEGGRSGEETPGESSESGEASGPAGEEAAAKEQQ